MVTTLWYLELLFFLFLINSSTCDEQQPKININTLGGQLGFLGDYAGLSPFESISQYISQSSLVMSSSSTKGDFVFTQFANINGTITTFCQIPNTNKYILAGDFTTINGTQYNHVVQLDTSTRQLSPLQQGLNGPVKSLLCANQTTIYVGGEFTAPVGGNVTSYGGGHVVIWNKDQWNPVPWKGLNGPVYSILQLQQSSILFAGKFDATGDGQFMNQNTSQSINLASSATISGGNSALSGNNTNPSSVICSQSPWLLQDDVPGYWEAQFGSSVEPSVFRISNTHLATQSTNEFNIISLGSNQYFQLSYIDPATNQIKTCSESCYLSNDTSLPYQDFTVTSPVTTNGIRIYINSWNGIGGGLGGVEIFRSDTSLTPVNSNNSNNNAGCATNTTPSSSATTSGGNWTQIYSYSNHQTYLVANFPVTQLTNSSVSATYQPFIASQGFYNVYITTPGCVGTSTCDQRTQVSLTINLTPGTTSTYFLDQNTSSDQRTLIYSGTIAASSSTLGGGAFQPSIVMHVASNATAPTFTTVSIIADSIEFIRNSTSSTLASILNYFPANNSYAALPQQLSPSSTVYTLQQVNNVVYIGGDFAVNGSYSNIVSYDFTKNSLVPLASNGLNGRVLTSVTSGTQLFVGGLFNNTAQGIKNVAMYDTQANTWNNMKGGVNDQVSSIYTTSDSVHLSGPFTNTVSNNQLTFNNAQWSSTNKDWIQPTSFISGPLSNQLDLGGGNTLYLGSIQAAQSYRANDVATVSSDSWSSAITVLDPNATVTSAVFYNTNTVILAGTFNMNYTTYHLAIYDGTSQWTGLLSNLNGSITSLYTLQNQLFIGGQFNGTTSGPGSSSITSFAVYDLQNRVFSDVQGLTTNNNQPGQVNVILPQPNGKSIFVGGNFSFAGLLNCNSICMLDTTSRQWSQLNQGISGNIKDMAVSDGGAVTVAGALFVNNANTALAVLDNINTASWRSISVPTATSIDSLLSDGGADSDAILSGKNANGQVYLSNWNGKDGFTQIDTSKLGPTTDIRHISYVPINSSPSSNRFPSDTNSMLMAVGNLDVVGVGKCSAALYDGSTWIPYILTSSVNGTSSGTIRQAFTVSACCTLDQIHHYLSVPAVILVSIAISLAIIFFLIALSFIYLFLKRKNNVKYYSDPMKEWKPKYRPQSLLAMLDTANVQALGGDDSGLLAADAIGAAAGAATAASSKREDVGYTTAYDGRGNNSLDISDSSRLRSSAYSGSVPVVGPGGAATPTAMPFSLLLANALKNTSNSIVASEETPKVYYAKYPFEAKEFGELAFDAHAPIVVTDTSDNVWWMGYKDDGYDKPVSGLFPSNYVSKAKPF